MGHVTNTAQHSIDINLYRLLVLQPWSNIQSVTGES